MIRFKNNVLPVWFQWDGDEASLERAKQSIVEDIQMNGLNHYTGFADILDEPEEADRNWDGSPVKEAKESKSTPKENTKKSTSKKTKSTGLKAPDLNKFASKQQKEGGKPSTDFDTNTETAS